MRAISHEQYTNEIKHAFKGKIRVIDTYVNRRTKIMHMCMKHNVNFIHGPYEALEGKHGCPKCKSEVKGAATLPLKEMIRRLPKDFIYVKGYEGIKSKCEFKCKKHSFIWSAVVDNLLRGHGCPKCKFDKASTNRYKRKTYKLGNRVVDIQGYENYALDWLLKTYKPNELLAGDSVNIKAFQWTDKEGKRHWTFPDILIKPTNTLVEVKSTYTLGIDVKRGWLSINKLKAKAAVKHDINYRMLIAKQNGSVIMLPKHWYKWDRDTIHEYIY